MGYSPSHGVRMTLREYMENEGLSVNRLAAAADVARMTIVRLRDGGSCQTRILDKLSAATGLSREELLPPPTVKPQMRRKNIKRVSSIATP